MASDPCAAELDWIYYLRRHSHLYRRPLRAISAGIFIIAIAAIFGFSREKSLSPMGGVFFVIGACFLFWGTRILHQWRRSLRSKFRYGCILPAVVIGEKPWRIAVYTDLRTGARGRPAVKVIGARLDLFPAGQPVIGQRVACVAYYKGDPVDGAWRDFFPTFVGLGIKSQAELGDITASLGEGSWYIAEKMIAAMPTKELGLHRMWRNG